MTATHSEQPKRIIYGMQNCEDVRLINCYYVDKNKTRFISEIETASRYYNTQLTIQ